MKKFFNISLAIGITAGSWAYLTNNLGVIPWPAFIGWSILFWEGANMKAVVRSLPNIILGALLGALTLYVQIHWATSALAASLAICVLAFTMTFAQNLKPFCVPCAIFVGCSHYYALSGVGQVNGFSFTAFWHAAGITSCGLIPGLVSMALESSINKVLVWKD